MQIATYRALIIAADEAGQVQIGQACASILEEEVAMAEWLMNHQQDIIRAFLARDLTPGEAAKR